MFCLSYLFIYPVIGRIKDNEQGRLRRTVDGPLTTSDICVETLHFLQIKGLVTRAGGTHVRMSCIPVFFWSEFSE
jgi:hypothetical protein